MSRFPLITSTTPPIFGQNVSLATNLILRSEKGGVAKLTPAKNSKRVSYANSRETGAGLDFIADDPFKGQQQSQTQ
jgi:hypothetical protein